MDRVQLEAEVVALHEEYAGELARYAANLAGQDDLVAEALQVTFLRYIR